MKKFLAILMAAIMAMTLCVACGTPADDVDTNNDTSVDNDTSADDTTEPAPEAKSVVVGYTDYAPMNFTDENGTLVGFDTDLAKAVFEKLGYTVMFKEIIWAQRYTELDAGTIDCIWNGFTANTADDDGVARSEKVDFSYNYMGNKQVVVASAAFAAEITDASAFAGKVGGVEDSSAGDTYLATFEGAIKKGLASQLDALRELTLGTVDFAVLDDQLAKAYVGKGDYADLAVVEGIESDAEYYAIGFKKGSELTALVNGALEELAADGTIATIAETYGVSNTAITDFADQK